MFNDLLINLVICGLLIVVLPIAWAVGIYNKFVKIQTTVTQSLSNINVELKRRASLIPNLVELVKGYSDYESSVLSEITRLRAEIQNNETLTPEKLAALDQKSAQEMIKLFAVGENYPELKAATAYTSLMSEYSNTEDRIAASRRTYNSNAQILNTRIRTFPDMFIAKAAGATAVSYFAINESEALS
jgi:LemA protein